MRKGTTLAIAVVLIGIGWYGWSYQSRRWRNTGDADPTVPVEESRRMFAALKALGANVQYIEFPGVSTTRGIRPTNAPICLSGG